MRIRELTLLNYRVYAEHQSFKFADRFTVVAGINGRGKIALLDGVALLCSRFLPLVSAARSRYRTVTPPEVNLGAAADQDNQVARSGQARGEECLRQSHASR